MAGFQGYLVKVANSATSNDWYTIPHSLIQEGAYDATYSALDLNSKRNGNGVLDRNVLPHKVAHCSISMRELTNSEVAQLFGSQGGITDRYVNELEKSIYVKMWVPEEDDYVTALCYIPDIAFKIKQIKQSPAKIKYASFTLEFIGY